MQVANNRDIVKDMRISPSVSTLVQNDNQRLTVQRDGDTLAMNETLGTDIDVLTLKDSK